MLINIKTFFKIKDLMFETDKKGVLWVKRNLKPESLVRIGPNYLVDKTEINNLFNVYVKKQNEIYIARVNRAKKLQSKGEME